MNTPVEPRSLRSLSFLFQRRDFVCVRSTCVCASRLMAPTGITMRSRGSSFSVLMRSSYKYKPPLLWLLSQLHISSPPDGLSQPSPSASCTYYPAATGKLEVGPLGTAEKHNDGDVTLKSTSDIPGITGRKSRVLLYI